MTDRRLSTDDVSGVYGLTPTPATDDAGDPSASFTVDLDETERVTRRLEADGVDGLMLTGTLAEGHSLTDEEYREYTRTVAEAADGMQVLAGPTTLHTRATIERAEFARDVGCEGILLGQPMWCELTPEETVDFYRDVAAAVPELGVFVYENPGAFKRRVESWRELAEIPQVVGAKYFGLGVEFWDAMRQVEAADGELTLLQMDAHWLAARTWFPERQPALWSASVSCDPLPVTTLYDAVARGDDELARRVTRRLPETFATYFPENSMRLFSQHKVGIEKARVDEAGYMKSGPARPPKTGAPERYREGGREAGRRWAALVEALEAEGYRESRSPAEG